jgi:hypothetical protein
MGGTSPVFPPRATPHLQTLSLRSGVELPNFEPKKFYFFGSGWEFRRREAAKNARWAESDSARAKSEVAPFKRSGNGSLKR